MKRDKISEAMGNISSRHIEEAAAFKVEEKKTLWVRWASIAACFCLIVVATFAIIPVFSDDENVNTGLPTDIDKIIWNNSSYAKNEYTEWNGFLIDTPLYDAFENSSDEYIAVVMTKADGKKIEESKYNEILEKTINREYKNENLYLFVTKEQFLNWKIENKSDYVFCLASRSSYEGTGTEVPTTSQTKESTAISPGVQNPSGQGEGHFSSYESILKLFRTAAYSMDTVNTNPRGLANGLFGIEDSPEKDWFMEIYYAIDYLYRNRSTPESKLYLGYAIKDLNRDGVDELVLIDKAYTVGAVFSQVNGKPVLLRAYEQRDSAWIDANGWLHENGSNGADYSTNAVYKIAEGGASLQLISEFGQDGTERVGEEAVTIYYKLVNREKVRITEAEFVALEEQYGEYLGSQDGAAATKEQAGLSFVSLFADGITGPAFSHFTSYESILRLCCMIVEDIDFEAYDSDLDTELFGQEDSIEKEWFNRLYSSFFLFHPGRGKDDHNSPHYKLSFEYAIKDLNGDGIDELVLLTDEYIVIAVFSMADGKPVLLGDYQPRGSCWIDENGWIHNNGSSGAMCWSNTVYKIAEGGASLELIVEFGACDHDFPNVPYYHLVNGEKVNITEAEHDALEEQYGKYLGYEAGAEATKEQAGLEFIPLFKDTNDPQEMLKAALNNEIKVYRKVSIYPNKAFESLYLKDYYLADVGMYFGEYDERAGHEYALVDLDGDSCKELVINSYGIVILRYYHGRVYMYPFTARQMHHLYTDGSFPAHSQEDGYLNVIEYQLYFDGADFMQKELCRTVTKDESHFECYIDGKQVTEEEMEYYQKKHPKAKIEFTPEVVWDEDPVSFLSPDVKNTWKEDLIDLFSNLDIWIPRNVYGSYAVGLMDLNFDNTPEVLVAYPGGSMGNVWVEIYDLKSHDEPIICYNAMGYQNAVFLYVTKVGAQYVTMAEGSIRDPEAGWCYCIESLSSDLYTGNLYLKTENLFAIADKINADGYGPYYYMGESVDKSKFDEEYQTFRNNYEVIRTTEMQMVMWSEFDLSNQEKAAREMANALVNTSQQFIEYKN